MPTLAKTIKEYEPKPDPMQQEKAMLEIELLKAQIQNEYAKANENNANATLDNAKANTEGATATNKQSDTDQKNLDYLEQESGVTHERDVDRIQSQAEANAKTKIIEGALKEKQEAKKAQSKTTV